MIINTDGKQTRYKDKCSILTLITSVRKHYVKPDPFIGIRHHYKTVPYGNRLSIGPDPDRYNYTRSVPSNNSPNINFNLFIFVSPSPLILKPLTGQHLCPLRPCMLGHRRWQTHGTHVGQDMAVQIHRTLGVVEGV